MAQIIFERETPSRQLIQEALAASVNRPFWLDDAARLPVFPSLQGEVETDLVIVGGGYLGLWTAILAKERDPRRKVLLLEAGKVGHAASGRNGGFCEASLTHGEKNGLSRWPDDMKQLTAMGLQNLDEFEQTLQRYHIECDFERAGLLTVAVEPYQDAELRDEHGYMGADSVRAEVASPTFLSGIWHKGDTAMLHPGKLVAGLLHVASELGVQIHEQSAVVRMSKHGNAIDLRTAQGGVLAQRVALATNAFPSLLKRFRLHTIPVYDYALMTEPLSRAQLQAVGWQNRQGIADMANQFHYYRITRDNRILFGGYDAVYHYGSKIEPALEERTETYERLASHFFTTFPQLAGMRFTHRWGGVIDTSTQFCAFFAQAMQGRVAYSAGFTGLGVGATRFAANVLLDKLDGLDTERTRLRMTRKMPMPFPPEPLRYVAVQTSKWSLDRADHHDGRRNLFLRTLDAMGLGFDS